MSDRRTTTACVVCGSVVYPHFHSETGETLYNVIAAANVRMTSPSDKTEDITDLTARLAVAEAERDEARALVEDWRAAHDEQKQYGERMRKALRALVATGEAKYVATGQPVWVKQVTYQGADPFEAARLALDTDREAKG